jgi:hypothetical protein
LLSRPKTFDVNKLDSDGNIVAVINNLTQYEKINNIYHGVISEAIKRNRILNGFYYKKI